jgi:glycerophosphoryl diester phosphodiesterase
MVGAATHRQHEVVPAEDAAVDTARVTRPQTGFPFLDDGLDQPGAVLAFAHRGGAFHPEIEGLENTLSAFEHAVALGYRYLETDVHATRDGALLAFHDAVLDRVTGSRGALGQMTHGDVRRALIGGREEIPTMGQLLEHFPDSRFNIDIKSDAAVEPLVGLLQAMDALDRVCIGSFSESRLRAFRRRAGPTAATACGPFAVLRAMTPGLRDIARLRGSGAVFQVPRRRKGLTILTAAFIARAHAAGLPVHVWTVDDRDEMHEVLDMGVDGLMTDRTDVLREVLLERGQWRGAAR